MRRLLAVLIVLWAVPAWAGTHPAASCSAAHVQDAMNAATEDGAIVTIPACSGASASHWTTQVSWSAPPGASLLGAGSLTTVGGGDATVIVDDYATNAPLLNITVAATGTFRMAGLTVQGGSGTLKDVGSINITGPGTIRLDHLHLNAQTYSPLVRHPIIRLNGQLYGVMDHCILDMYSVGAIYMANGANSGNTDWATSTNFGGGDYFFVEDSVFVGQAVIYPPNTTYDSRAYDCFTGGKVVVRFNTFTHVTMGEDHSTGHAADDRGCRSHEIYGNYMAPDPGTGDGNTIPYPPFDMIDIGAGTALLWGNQATLAAKNVFHFNVTRKNDDTYPQVVPPDGWGYCGTAFNGTGSVWDESAISATGYACLDQPGRGMGDLLINNFPNKLNNRTGTRAWPQQTLEPIYIWSNVASEIPGWMGSYYSDASGGRVVANRDYYPQSSGIQTSSSSPFNGTTGTGWGTIANRPTTCTTGVGYWATNEGSWNISASNPYGVQQNGADGLLYKCTSTNTWTLYYTPYTYPHPVASAGTAPSAPANVRIR